MTRTAAIGLAIFVSAGTGLRQALAFDYFEHRYLGNEAYQVARKELKDTAFLESLDKASKELGLGNEPGTDELADELLRSLPMEFGDLSGLAGDFTKSVVELKALMIRIKKEDWPGGVAWLGELVLGWLPRLQAEGVVVATRRHWYGACRWLYRSRRDESPGTGSDWKKCFEKLPEHGSNKPPARLGSGGYRATREELAESEMISKYVSLAAENRDHFPRHSWNNYTRFHRKALQLAQCYSEKNKECVDFEAKVEHDLLVEALLNEAFAQHYLQDSFASGHIGSGYGECHVLLLYTCIPPKRRLEQTHDSLNELGLDVTIAFPVPYVWQYGDGLDMNPLPERWTAFGDRHLFIREADFHREVIVRTATKSIAEVFTRAGGRDKEQPPQSCQMCTPEELFPIPQDKRLLSKDSSGDLVGFRFLGESLDPRVPGIPVEGWKLSSGYAKQRLQNVPSPGGAMFKLHYMRNTDPIWPNSYGIEFWNLPDLRTSYQVSAGYSWPRQLSPWSLTVKAKAGWRSEDNFTTSNPTVERRYGRELSIPSLEITREIYRPVAVFGQINPLTLTNFQKFGYSREAGIHRMSWALGLRFDLSGI